MDEQPIKRLSGTKFFWYWVLLHMVGVGAFLVGVIQFGYYGAFFCLAIVGLFQGFLIGAASISHGKSLMQRWIGGSFVGALLCILGSVFGPSELESSIVPLVILIVVYPAMQAVSIYTYVPNIWIWIVVGLLVAIVQVIGFFASYFLGGLPAIIVVVFITGILSSFSIGQLLHKYLDIEVFV